MVASATPAGTPAGPGGGHPRPSARDQHELIGAALVELGCTTRAARLAELTRRQGREIRAFAALNYEEAAAMIVSLAASLAEREGKTDA